LTLLESATQLRIYLFGQPRFEVGATPFRFVTRPKGLPLLAYLLMHRDRAVSRDALAFLLWEDETEQAARANLRRHLHHVQHALPPSPEPWLLVDAETVCWNSETAYWLDVAEFEQQVATPRGRARAVELYAGDLLSNLYDEWLFEPRERLRERYLAALSELVIDGRAARRLTDAAAYAQRILAVDPWREDALRQLIAIRYESGDRSGALVAFDRFRHRLRDELNVDPMPDTIAIRDAIARNEPLPLGGGEPDPGVPLQSGPAALAFAGRARELERLRALWSTSARGRGTIVFLSGEAGVGKTRLSTEFALRAQAQGARILWGGTAQPESAPYQALSEALRDVAGLIAALEINPLWLAAASQLLPELADRRPDLPALHPLDPEHEQTRLFEALAACLSGLAKARPLVLVLEDLHWAGPATIAALEFITRRLRGRAVLTLATHRDDELPMPLRILRRRLQQDDLARHVGVSRLEPDAVYEIVALTVGIRDGGTEVARRLYDASEGNPLFLSELIRGIQETGSQPLALTLQTVVSARIARLDDRSRFLLDAASVVGSSFDTDVAREIIGWDERELLEAIDDLLARHLIREAGNRAGFDYAFTHQLIQTTVYDQLEQRQRERWHRRTAKVLERIHADALEPFASAIARHFERGDDTRRALPYFLAAARFAESLHADDEALDLIARCLEHDPEKELCVELLFLREMIHRRRGDRLAQRDDLERLAHLTRDAPDESALEILHRKTLLARSLGERDEELAFTLELARVADMRGSVRWRARALAAQAQYLALVNRFEEAEGKALEALSLQADSGAIEDQVAVLCLLGSVLTNRGMLVTAREYLERARALANEQTSPTLVAGALLAAAGGALMRHEFDQCLDLAGMARDIYGSFGDREGEADAIARVATASARLGSNDDARRMNLEAAAIFESIGKRQGVAVALVNAGLISCRLALFGEARAHFERAEHLFNAIEDVRGQAVCAINRSWLRLNMGRPQEAKIAALSALELARRMKTPAYEAEALANLGGAERDLGEVDSAIAHMLEGLERQAGLGRPSDRVADQADLALAYLYANDIGSAGRLVDEFLPTASSAIESSPCPQNFYWVAARIYRAMHRDAEWPPLLERANALVRSRAAGLPSEGDQHEFLAIPVNQAILAAASENRWPEP
jgi:DNA-binding SARP family transcriptional activator/tetratricopeptide (TPR) repeat protein